MKLLMLGIFLLVLVGCANGPGAKVEAVFDRIVVGAEDEFCAHSRPHQELMLDEVNEELKQSKLTWECKK